MTTPQIEEEYYEKILAGVQAVILSVGGAEPETMVEDFHGHRGAHIRFHPATLLRALSSVMASVAIQSGITPTKKDQRALADTIRKQFLEDYRLYEAAISAGATLSMPEGKPN